MFIVIATELQSSRLIFLRICVPMAYVTRSRSPPRPSRAPRSRSARRSAAEGAFGEPSILYHTHLAATILDQAVQLINASASEHARPRNQAVIHLKRYLIDATHAPLTRDELAKRSVRGLG